MTLRLTAALRAIRLLAIVGLAVEVLYLVAVNVFLSTSLFERVVDASPESVDIHFERGWSIFPTRVHARKLSIRGTDSHLEWMLRIDKVDFECSLLSLLRREFRVTSVEGDGISFRARFKVSSPAAVPELLQFLPPIASLPAVGLIPDEPPDPGTWDDRRWHLWTVHIANADARHVREIWIENDRFTGEAHVQGGFYLKPIRSVEVGPITVEAHEGTIAIKSVAAVDRLQANATMHVERFDPRMMGGADLLHRLSLSATGSLEIPDLGSVASSALEGATLAGPMSMPGFAIRVAKGVLEDGSRVDARATDTVVNVGERRATVGIIGIDAGIEAKRLSAHVVMDRLESDLSLGSPRATVDIDSSELDLASPLGDLHAVGTIAQAELRDARRLGSVLLPSTAKVQVAGGRLDGSAKAEVWRREARVQARVNLRGSDIKMLAGDVEVAGAANLDASVSSLRWDTLQADDVRVSALIEKGLVAKRTSGDPWVQVVALRLGAEGGHVDLAHPWNAFQASVEGDDVEVLESSSLRSAFPHSLGANMHLGSGRVRFQTSARLTVDDGNAHAAISAASRSVRVTSSAGQAEFDIAARAAAGAPLGSLDVPALDEASIDLTHVTVRGLTSPSRLTVEHIAAAATTPAFHVRDPLRALDVILQVGGARLEDAAALSGFLPPSFHLTTAVGGGAIEGRVTANVADGAVRGRGWLDARGLGVTTPHLHVLGDIRASAALTHGSAKTLAGELSLVSTRLEGGFEPRATAADVIVKGLRVHAASKGFDVSHPSLASVEYALDLGEAELVDARALNVFLPTTEILAIESGSARATLDMTSGHAGARGRMDLQLSHGGLVLGDTHFAGDFGLRVQARRGQGDATPLDVEGTELTMTDVRVTGATTDTSHWSGNLTVEAGHLDLDPRPRLDADLVLRARDANPILAALFRDTLSHTIAGLTHMPSLTAVTHLSIDSHQLLMSDLLASGGDLSVRGAYAVRGHRSGGSTGAFVLHKGPVSVGMDVDAGGSHLKLFGLDKWYRGRAAEVTLEP